MGAGHSNIPRLIGVVEDDAAVLNSLEFSLQAEGYRVCAFTCAADVDVSQEILHADCLVIDFALPDRTGAALLRALRKRGMTCPAMIIASSPTARCRQEVGAVGAPLVEKPLMGPELIDHIRQALTPTSGGHSRV